MINITKDNLKKNNLPTINSMKITSEQAKIIAQIIYHLLESDIAEEKTA